MKSIVKEKNNRLSSYFLAAILIIAFLLRLIHGLSYGFANDEFSALSRLQFNNLSDLLNKGVAVDAHPLLVQFFLYFWTKIFGTSLLAVRLPFILAGTASVWVVYKAGCAWFNKETGLISAAIIAFSGYTILFSEIARPYSFGFLFSTLTLLYWGIIFIRKETSLKNFILFGLWVSLSMYTHYFSFFVSGLMFASALFFLNKTTYKKYLIASLLILVLYLPYVPVFLQQISYGGVGGPGGWLGAPSPDWLWIYFVEVNNGSFLLVFISVIGFILSLLIVLRNKKYTDLLLPAWFFIAYLFGYVYSIKVNPILQHSIMIFSYSGLVIFISYGLTNLNKVLNPFLSTVLISLVVFATTDQSGFFRKQHFGQFELPANDFKTWINQVPQTKTFSLFDVNHAFYIDYYLKENDPKPDIYEIEQFKSRQRFLDALNNPSLEYMIFGWSTRQPQSEIYSAIQTYFPFTLEENIYFNSRISLFSRNNPENLKTNPDLIVFEKSKKLNNEAQQFSPEKEYGANLTLNNIVLPDSLPLKIEAIVKLSSRDSLKGLLVIDALLENGENLWKGKNLSLFKNREKTYEAFTTLVLPKGSKGIKKLKVYIWNNKKENFSVSNVRVQIKENKEGYVYLPHFYQ